MDKLSSIKEELKLRKITRKKINDIENLKTEVKEMEQLKIKMIQDRNSKLLGDLIWKKELK